MFTLTTTTLLPQYPEPCTANNYLAGHVAILRNSLRHWTRQELIAPELQGRRAAEWLYRAPFFIASHTADAEPIFNYGNLMAQHLFELSWDELMILPSRCSAEPVNQVDRDRLLADVTAKGYIDNYSGVRISKSGKRFQIEHAIVWNLLNNKGQFCGQAAMFNAWQPL
jgi:hypothetical protein